MNKELIILIGNIGSGKSTLCEEYVKKGYLIVSQDDLRYSIGAGKYTFDYLYEPCIKETIQTLARVIMQKSIPLIVDETNMSKVIRLKYLFLANLHEYKTTALVLPILSEEESVKRRLQNNHGDTDEETWKNVWKMFDIMYEEPTIKEGFDELIFL